MSDKIIIVEDDPFTRQFYDHLFSRTSYEVVQTEDADQLLKNLLQERYALLILDINLKNTFLNGEKTDGVKIAKHIKQNEKLADLPILLVTAYQNGPGSKDFLKESLADDYITKPISDFNQLLEKVDKLTAN